MSTHPCPVDGCGRQVGAHWVMCRKHWVMVPPLIQRMLYDSWNGGRPNIDYITIRKIAVECLNRQSH